VKNLAGSFHSPAASFSDLGDIGLQYLQCLNHPRGGAKDPPVAILLNKQTVKAASACRLECHFQHSCEMLITGPRKRGIDPSMVALPKWRVMFLCLS
jgi:hypothetical protein